MLPAQATFGGGVPVIDPAVGDDHPSVNDLGLGLFLDGGRESGQVVGGHIVIVVEETE
jgi:hypothetical protein